MGSKANKNCNEIYLLEAVREVECGNVSVQKSGGFELLQKKTFAI